LLSIIVRRLSTVIGQWSHFAAAGRSDLLSVCAA
jgi:hypothetical protein